MAKKWLVVLLSFLLAAGVLAACNSDSGNSTNGNGNGNGNDNDSNAEQIDYAAQETDITIFSLYSQTIFDEILRPYLEDEFPNFTFTNISTTEGQTIEELVVAGTPIDIYIGRSNGIYNTFGPLGLTYDISDLVEQHGVDLDAFEEVYIDDASDENGLYALPLNDETLVLYYNNELFERFGVAPPTDGMTWDEALDLAEEMTRFEDGTQYVGMWTSPNHYLRMAQGSLDFLDSETDEVTVDTDEWRDIIETVFLGPARDNGFRDRTSDNFYGHADFNQDRVIAMYMFMTNWVTSSRQTFPLMDWDIVSIPHFEGSEHPGTQPYADYMGITSISESKDAAMLVLKYLTSEEFQTHFSSVGRITPLKSQEVRDAYSSEHHQFGEKNFQAVFYYDRAPNRNTHRFDQDVLQLFTSNYVQDLVLGNTDLNTTLARWQEEASAEVRRKIQQGD